MRKTLKNFKLILESVSVSMTNYIHIQENMHVWLHEHVYSMEYLMLKEIHQNIHIEKSM